jgi:hypothetical protein
MRFYTRVVRWSVRHRWITLVAGIGANGDSLLFR